MKLFQNPIVVGVLALVAAVLVFRSAIQPMLKRNAPAKRQPAAAAAVKEKTPPPPAVPAAPAPADARKVEPGTGIDLARVGWDVNGTPPRDPFQLNESLLPPARLAPPASEVLNLTAIWRQTGESLAVINGRILGRGEEIEGYQIDSMENGLVWVTGPAGRESLEFRSGAPAQTNASPGTAAATTPGPKSGG
jgi:hypothetical protein